MVTNTISMPKNAIDKKDTKREIKKKKQSK